MKNGIIDVFLAMLPATFCPEALAIAEKNKQDQVADNVGNSSLGKPKRGSSLPENSSQQFFHKTSPR